MDNVNTKTATLNVNVRRHGAGQDVILIKNCLLYVRGNEARDLNGPDIPSIFSFREDGAPEPANNIYELGAVDDLGALLTQYKTGAWKKSFLVFKNQKYTTVNTENIAYFYIRNNAVQLVCFDKQVYTLNRSLDQITAAVSPEQFYRVNRQYLVNFSAIKEVELYFMRKLYVKLQMETPDKLFITKEKTTGFLSWMEDR